MSKQNGKALIKEENMGFFQQIFHTDEWYDKLKKPSITPPKIAFPIVWSILYVMIAASLYYYVRKTGLVMSTGLVFYIIQLVLNLCWTPIFFWAKMTTFALIECLAMWVSILITIVKFYQVDQTAAYLLIPYILWVCVAFYLNLYVVLNNPDPYFVKKNKENKSS